MFQVRVGANFVLRQACINHSGVINSLPSEQDKPFYWKDFITFHLENFAWKNRKPCFRPPCFKDAFILVDLKILTSFRDLFQADSRHFFSLSGEARHQQQVAQRHRSLQR